MEFNVLLAVLTAFTCLPSFFSGSSSLIVSVAQAADTTGTETNTQAATVTITEITGIAGTETHTQADTVTITLATDTSGTATTTPAATVTITEIADTSGTETTTQIATVTITELTATAGTATTTPAATVTITEITDTSGTETTTQTATVTIIELTATAGTETTTPAATVTIIGASATAGTETTTQAATVTVTEVSDKGGTTETSVNATLTSTSSFTQWCTDNCPTAEHKYCQIINSNPDNTGTWNVSSCSCQPGYLPVGSDCVSEDLIIGVSVGVGAAIILGLTIAVICLAIRKPSHSSGKSDTNSSDGKEFVQMEEAHVNKSTPKVEHAPAAAAAAAAVISGDVAHVVKVDDGHVTTAAAAAVTAATGSDVKAATDAAVVTAAVVAPRAKLEPQTSPVTAFPLSYAQPEIMTPDYDLAQPMPLNTQYNSNDFAASFVTFTPQLQNVDTSSNFSIKRPTAVTSGSQPGHSSQNPSYKDFF